MLSNEVYEKSCLVENEKLLERTALMTWEDNFNTINLQRLDASDYRYVGPIVLNYLINGKRFLGSVEKSHVLFVGTTGSGKTTCYVCSNIEAILRSKTNESLFVMDYKGGLCKSYGAALEDAGYVVYIIDGKEPLKSSGYNPIAKAWDYYMHSKKTQKKLDCAKGDELFFQGIKYRTHEEWRSVVKYYIYDQMDKCQNLLRRVSQIIAPIVSSGNDLTWQQSAQQMMYLLMLGMLEDGVTGKRNMTKEKFTICNAIRIGLTTDDDFYYIKKWIEDRDENSEVRGLNKFYNDHAKQTRDGHLSSFALKVLKWLNICLESLTSKNDIDTDDIVRRLENEKVAIFCITDENRPETYDLCMMLISNLITSIKTISDTEKPLKNDFHFILDEFANMPKMPNIENSISTLRSYKTWLHLGIQSYNQLNKYYDENVREIILDNCNTQVFFGCNNASTVKRFSEELGVKSVPAYSYGLDNNNNLTKHISIVDTPVVKPSELMDIKFGEAYVKAFRSSPLYTKIDPYFLVPEMQHKNLERKSTASTFDYDKNIVNITKLIKKNKLDFDF